MPTLDVVFIGKMHLPEVGGGPIQPPAQPPGIWPPDAVVRPPIYYPPTVWPPDAVVRPPIYYPPQQPPGVGIWPSPPGGVPPVGGYPGYPAPPDQIWPSPGHPSHPIAPGGEPPVLWPPPGVVSPPIYLPPQIWPKPPEGTPPEGSPPGIWPKPDFPHVSQPISGGGYVIGWHPQLGYVKIPLGGAPGEPVASPTPPETPAPTP